MQPTKPTPSPESNGAAASAALPATHPATHPVTPSVTSSANTRDEPIVVLEPVIVDDARVRVELHSPCCSERLHVRQFTPDWLVVEVRGGRRPASPKTAATLEIGEDAGSNGAESTAQRFRCQLEFGGWEAVSGNLDGDKIGAARLRLTCTNSIRQALIRVYRQMQFPGLCERSDVDPTALLALFGSDRGHPPTATWFSNQVAGEQPGSAPELGSDMVYRSDVVYQTDDGVLLGHLSVTRAYSNTWIVHQLRMVHDHPQSAAARLALYHHFATAPVLLDEHQQQYLISYYDRGQDWHRMLFEGFVKWYDESDQATSIGFDRFEFGAASEPSQSSMRAVSFDRRVIEIDQVRPTELEQAIALVRSRLPELACAAFDIDADRLDRAYLHPAFAAQFATHGITRGRQAFVVREAGELVGLALCEVGSESLDLDNLFNVTQLYLGEGASIEAQRALVGFVRNHHRALGQAQPTLLVPQGTIADPELIGLRCAETLGCMIWSGQTLRAYRTFLRTTFARLLREQEQQRPAIASSSCPNSMIEAVYLPRISSARARVYDDARLEQLVTASLGPIELLGFLLHYAALGVGMAESAERSLRLGVGRDRPGEPHSSVAMVAAAERQAEHGRLLLDDVFELGQRWRNEVGVRINVELLLHQPPPRSVLRWSQLHTAIARGPIAAGLLAIDYEVARMYASIGPMLLDTCARLFVNDLRPGFAVAVNSTTVARPRAAVELLLTREPTLAGALAEAGAAGIGVYLDVIGDCVELGRELAARARAGKSGRSGAGSPGKRAAHA